MLHLHTCEHNVLHVCAPQMFEKSKKMLSVNTVPGWCEYMYYVRISTQYCALQHLGSVWCNSLEVLR